MYAYEAMLGGYLALKDTASAKDILYKMEDKNIVSDLHYARILNAMGTMGAVSDADALMSRMVERQVSIRHPSTCAQVIWVLCSTGKVEEGFKMYEHTRARGLSLEDFAPRALEVLVRYNVQEAMRLVLRDGEKAGVDAYTPVLQALFTSGEHEKGMELLRDIEAKRLPLTQSSLLVAVKLLSRAGHMQTALNWVEKFEKQGEKASEEVNGQVLSTYLYHGRVTAAYKKLTLLRGTGELNTTLYNVLIQGLVYRGQVDEAWKQLERMAQDGINPNAQTFAFLAQCADLGRLQV